MNWARTHDNGYECSSRGDTRFSAIFAKLSDGRTIEEAYQLEVKGYQVLGNDWHLGKGKKVLNNKTHSRLWDEYLTLWWKWAQENPDLIDELTRVSAGKVLTDMFANTDINKARALSQIINSSRAL